MFVPLKILIYYYAFQMDFIISDIATQTCLKFYSIIWKLLIIL